MFFKSIRQKFQKYKTHSRFIAVLKNKLKNIHRTKHSRAFINHVNETTLHRYSFFLKEMYERLPKISILNFFTQIKSNSRNKTVKINYSTMTTISICIISCKIRFNYCCFCRWVQFWQIWHKNYWSWALI